MPAIGSRILDARARGLRLVALAVALLFLGTVACAWPDMVQARDWTPQIKVTRRAQVYWEGVMRAADGELREIRKTTRQARRKLDRIETRLRRTVEHRARAKRSLATRRAELASVRGRSASAEDARSAAAPSDTPAIPEASATLGLAVVPTLLDSLASPITGLLPDPPAVETGADSDAAGPEVATAGEASASKKPERAVRQSQRHVRQARREFRQAKRQTRRVARNARSARSRLRALKAAHGSALTRRDSAERNLGAWILAMTHYGRIRAAKKSRSRPGVTTPFAWPVRGRISQRYHAGHDGLDIVRYRGAAVRSMAFGVVTYVGWNPWDQHGRAFMVVVTHAGGYETLYGHLLPRRVVRVGQEMRKGEIVGYMGNTGNSSGPHLHLELRRGRTTLDPLGFL